ncbi:MAG: hypothetical protein WCA12_07450 [Burkholderiales bacterium]
MQPALEKCPRPLLVMLAIEARLNGLAGRFPACESGGIAVQLERVPTAIEFDHLREYRAGLDRQRLHLRQNRVRFDRLSLAILQSIDPMPGETGHAAILVLCRVGESAQPLRRSHALRSRFPRLGLPGGKRELDQRVFASNAGDRDAAALGVLRAVRHLGANCIRAVVRLEQRPCAGTILRFGEHVAQRGAQGNSHRRIGFRIPGSSKGGEIGTTTRRGGADLRSWV